MKEKKMNNNITEKGRKKFLLLLWQYRDIIRTMILKTGEIIKNGKKKFMDKL